MEKKFLPFYVGVLLLGMIISVIWNIALDVGAHGSIDDAVKELFTASQEAAQVIGSDKAPDLKAEAEKLAKVAAELEKQAKEGTNDAERDKAKLAHEKAKAAADAAKELADLADSIEQMKYNEIRRVWLDTVMTPNAKFYLDMRGEEMAWVGQMTQLFDFFAKNVKSVDSVSVEYNKERLAALACVKLTVYQGRGDNEGDYFDFPKARKADETSSVTRRILMAQHYVRASADSKSPWEEWIPKELIDGNKMVDGVPGSFEKGLFRKNIVKDTIPKTEKQKFIKSLGDYKKGFAGLGSEMKSAVATYYVNAKFKPFKKILKAHTKKRFGEEELRDSPKLTGDLNNMVQSTLGNEALEEVKLIWEKGSVVPKKVNLAKVVDGRAAMVRVRLALPKERNLVVKDKIKVTLLKKINKMIEPHWPKIVPPNEVGSGGEISVEDLRAFDAVKEAIPKIITEKIDEKIRDEIVQLVDDLKKNYVSRRKKFADAANLLAVQGVLFTPDNFSTIAGSEKIYDDVSKGEESELFRIDNVDALMKKWKGLVKKRPRVPDFDQASRDFQKIKTEIRALIPEGGEARVIEILQNIRGKVFKDITDKVDKIAKQEGTRVRPAMDTMVESRIMGAVRKACGTAKRLWQDENALLKLQNWGSLNSDDKAAVMSLLAAEDLTFRQKSLLREHGNAWLEADTLSTEQLADVKITLDVAPDCNSVSEKLSDEQKDAIKGMLAKVVAADKAAGDFESLVSSWVGDVFIKNEVSDANRTAIGKLLDDEDIVKKLKDEEKTALKGLIESGAKTPTAEQQKLIGSLLNMAVTPFVGSVKIEETLTAEDRNTAKAIIRKMVNDFRKKMQDTDPKDITNREEELYFVNNYVFVQRAVPGSAGLSVGWFPVSQAGDYGETGGLKKLADEAGKRQNAIRAKKADEAGEKREKALADATEKLPEAQKKAGTAKAELLKTLNENGITIPPGLKQ